MTASMNHCEDQITFSEHLTTMPLPEKRAARIGESRLCRAIVCRTRDFQYNGFTENDKTLTVVP